jgi:short subunit dehydrogenase-like uncharacterized protein
MIYGANGYTGRLIARHAVERGLKPVLAGRNRNAVAALAGELGCEYDTFSLEPSTPVAEHLKGISAVLHCAGPFSQTARPMMDACIASRTNYLDITGEIEIILAASERSEQAEQAGVALLPAVGFDVVPSDCLAAMLAARLPAARVLQLAFAALGGLSPGTSKTMMEALPGGGRVRIDGEIRQVPIAWKSMEIPFRDGPKWGMTIPWGDVASAYYSTGIGNIEVYTTASLRQIKQLRRIRFVLPLLGWKPLQHFLQRRIERHVKGPSTSVRESSRSSLWGRVSDDQGNSISATLETLSGYKLTALTAVAALERTLQHDVPRGFHTASQAFGNEFILSFPETDIAWTQRQAAPAELNSG